MKLVTATFEVPDGTTGQEVVDVLVEGKGFRLIDPQVLRIGGEADLAVELEDEDHITVRDSRAIQALRDNAEEDRKVNADWESADDPIVDDPPAIPGPFKGIDFTAVKTTIGDSLHERKRPLSDDDPPQKQFISVWH